MMAGFPARQGMNDVPLSPASASLPAGDSGLFPATMWSMIQAVKGEGEALAGLERLARAYRRPLYVFARQKGMGHEGAEDAVQGFFAHLLSHEMLGNVRRGEVRFRSFLLRCFTNWLLNERKREHAAKRGGAAAMLAVEEFDSRVDEPALIEGEAPDRAYDRNWARVMVDQAMGRLDAELAQRERQELMQELRRRTFATNGENPDWEALAARFGMNHGAVRKAAADLRRRFGALLREEVRNVVSNDAEVDEELRYLVSLLSAS